MEGSLAINGDVNTLKVAMLAHEQVELPTRHYFHGGLYCREVWQPAGALVVGKVHKREHLYMLVFGTLLIGGENRKTVTGPSVIKSDPGTQRAIYAMTDALYMTFHRTDATNVADAEAELVEYDEASPFGVGNTLQEVL